MTRVLVWLWAETGDFEAKAMIVANIRMKVANLIVVEVDKDIGLSCILDQTRIIPPGPGSGLLKILEESGYYGVTDVRMLINRPVGQRIFPPV